MLRFSVRSAAVFGISLFAIAACPAATMIVDPDGSGDFTQIQVAIDAAADGDTVLVKPGEYVVTESIDLGVDSRKTWPRAA